MAGDSLGSLVVKISGDMAEMKTAMDKAQYAAEQAFNKIEAAGKKMQAALINSAATAGAGLVAGFAISGIKDFIDDTIKATAALQQMSEKTGATVESLSAIRSVAKLSGTDIGGVESALIKMAKGMTGADDQTKGFGGALAYLGLSAKDAQGNLKSTDALFLDIAKSLETYADGAGKTALAQALFGKAGAQMIPVLKDLATVGEYNAKVTADQAEAADRYEKNLMRLSAMKSAVSKQIVIEMIPAMDDLVTVFLRAQKSSDGFRAQLGQLVKDGSIKSWADDAAMWVAHFIDTFNSIVPESKVALQQVRVSLASFNEYAARIGTAGIANPLSKMFAENLAKEEAYLRELEGKAKRANTAYQTMLGQQAGGRKEGATLDGPEGAATALGMVGRRQANPNLAENAAKGVDLIAQAWKFYGDVLGQIAGQEKTYTEGMEKLLLLYNKRLITVQQLSVAEKFLYDTKTQAGQEIARLALENAKIADQIDLMRGVGIATTGTAEAAANYAITYGKLKDLYQYEKDHITALARGLDLQNTRLAIIKELEQAQRQYVAAVIQAFDAERQWRESMSANNDALYANAFAYNKSLADEVALLGATSSERERAIAIRERDFAVGQAELALNPQLAESFKKLYAERLKLIDAKADKSALLELSNSLTDALVSGFQSGKSAATVFLDWLKAEFAKTVLRPVIQTAVNAGFGALGIGAAGSANAAGGPLFGGIASAFSDMFTSSGAGAGWGMNDRSLGDNSLAGLMEKYWGTNSDTLKGIGSIAAGIGVGSAVGKLVSDALGHGDTHHDHQNIGTVVGSIIGAYWGAAGSMIGGAIGSTVGSIIDSFNEGDIERTARIGTGARDYTYSSSGGRFGDIGIERFSDKGFSDSEMGQTLRVWFDTIGKLDKEVARHFSGDEITRATAALAGQSTQYSFGMEHTGLDPETLSTIVRARFTAIFGVVDQQMADLVSNFKGSGEDLVTLIVDLSTVHERLTGLHDSFTSLFGQQVGFSDLAALKGDTEGYTEALSRLAGEYAVTNQIAEMLGKTQAEVWGAIGLASEGARAHLIDLAGGLDKLSQQLDFYYSHFYSTAEQQAHTLATLQQAFSDVGVAMPGTVDGFREVTDRFLGMGEAGAQAAASMLALAPTFYAYIGAIEEVGKAIKGNADTFKMIFGEAISTDGIRGLQQNGETLTATLTRVTSEFAATNELLALFGLQSSQVFGTFGLASEAARAKLIELSGGLDKFTANLTSFYQNYFSEQERTQRSMDSLKGTFAALGLEMPTTLQGFRDLVERELKLGPAGAQAAATLLAIQQQFYDLHKPITQVTTDIGALIGTITGKPIVKPPAVDDLGAAAAIAHANLVKLNETLRNSFQDAYRSIELAGLSNQQQYAYLQREAAGLVTSLQGAGTGEQVQNFADKIRSDMLAAFNLLAPDEQGARRSEFLANLLKVQEMVTTRLQALDPLGTLGKPIVEPAAAAAAAQAAAAATNQESAGVFKKAADTISEAAQLMYLTQQMVKQIRVEFPNVGLTVEAGA